MTDERPKDWSEKDEAYMKKYVESHPDNRMAWYLLGKQYEREGQIRKASYCYDQAGDIYKAFENEPLPKERLQEERMQLVQAHQERLRKRHRSKQRMRSLLALLLLLLLGSFITGEDAGAPSNKIDQAGPKQEKKVVEDEKKQPSKPPVDGLANVIYVPDINSSQSDRLLRGAVVKAAKEDDESTLVTLEKKGRWAIWTQQPEVWAVVKKEGVGKSGRVLFPSLPDCKCEPDKLQAVKLAKAWARDAEHQLMAMSAHAAVIHTGKKPPATVKELAKGYPSNVVAGVNKEWSPRYEQVRSELPINKSLRQVDNALDKKWSAGEAGPFKEPLRIIIDKKTHRLAVVSGSIIIRNYKVGLGGSRTPKGSFTISEKVVNPNGSSTGVYGSRGMALSDTNYAIHGTNDLGSIGKDKSMGCIRLLNEDVEELFNLVAIGTKVTITSGELPDITVVPDDDDRYRVPLTPKQENPKKVYNWLS